MLRRTVLMFWSLFVLQLLAACGTTAGPAATPSNQATAAPRPAASAPTAVAATAQPPTAQPATQLSAAPDAPTDEAAIAEGLTAEGYHMLGRSDAPVTLTMYSDFL